MAINESLLIAAPVLQDYLVDKDTGLPLSAGIITLYSDTQRSVLKPWYTQQGTNPPYSYVPLPNPMTLSAGGTIQDNSGNDVIPYFYPYESDNVTFDSYYILVQNSNLEEQFTRSNFPFVANTSTGISISTNENLLVNNCFWRNSGTLSLSASTVSGSISINNVTYNYWTLAPSQHDNNTMPDINYFKNATDGTEVISFPSFVSTFNDNVLEGDITPECYMNINCSSIGSSSVRYLQIPLMTHIDSLSGYVNDSFTIQAMSADGLNETLTIGIFQYCGTGVTSPAIAVKTIVLSPSWNKFTINLPIPTAQGVTVSQGNDDGLYIQIGFPTTSSFNVNIALPSFYLSDTPATNSFQTYDEVNAIVSSPRTGDVRISTNSFVPYGWAPMNDGVLSLNVPVTGVPVSKVGNDTWLLYNQLWNIAKSADGSTTPICPMYNITTGSIVSFGSNAYGDFINNRGIGLTKMLGQVIMGTVPVSQIISQGTGLPVNTSYAAVVTSWTSGTGSILQVNIASPGLNVYVGRPIIFTGTPLPSNIVAGHVYYAAASDNQVNISGTQFYLTNTADDAIKRQNYITYMASSGGAIASLSPTGSTGGEYSHIQTAGELFHHTHSIGSGNGGGLTGFNATVTPGSSSINTQFTGLGLSMNVVPSNTFYNMFIKL